MHPKPPNTIATFWIIAQLELERLFFSKQGWLYLTAFSFFWYLLLHFVIFNVSALIVQQAQGNFGWSAAIFATYFRISVYAFPLLCVFIAANQTGSDRERGTLRFIMLRCSRATFFFGRFLSQVLIQFILITATLLATLAVGFYKGDFSFSALIDAMIMGANVGLVILPFIAMMSVLSALITSPRQATIVALLIWAMASGFISLLSYYVPFLDFLKLLVPGMHFAKLLALDGAAMFSLAYVPILQCAVLLTVGYVVMKREPI